MAEKSPSRTPVLLRIPSWSDEKPVVPVAGFTSTWTGLVNTGKFGATRPPILCLGFLQLDELCPGIFEHRNIGVGIFPERRGRGP